MNPDHILPNPDDRIGLTRALGRFATQTAAAAARRNVFTAAQLEQLGLDYEGNALTFATGLVAALVARPVVPPPASEHPLCAFLAHVFALDPAQFGFTPDDVALAERLLREGRDRIRAVSVRQSVGMIETVSGVGIGTGVLLPNDYLLTCQHVLSKARAQNARVRFDYRLAQGGGQTRGRAFDLDLSPAVRGGGALPDFVLLVVRGAPDVPSLSPAPVALNSGDVVRAVHHPGGKPVVVSSPGRVRQVGKDYVIHDLGGMAEGSSGAPVFTDSWELCAIHRGQTPQTDGKTFEAVPVTAFWDTIRSSVTAEE